MLSYELVFYFRWLEPCQGGLTQIALSLLKMTLVQRNERWNTFKPTLSNMLDCVKPHRFIGHTNWTNLLDRLKPFPFPYTSYMFDQIRAYM